MRQDVERHARGPEHLLLERRAVRGAPQRLGGQERDARRTQRPRLVHVAPQHVHGRRTGGRREATLPSTTAPRPSWTLSSTRVRSRDRPSDGDQQMDAVAADIDRRCHPGHAGHRGGSPRSPSDQVVHEPVPDALEVLHPPERLAAAGQLMGLVGGAHQADRATMRAQDREQLLRLRDGAAEVLLGMLDEQRRAHPAAYVMGLWAR